MRSLHDLAFRIKPGLPRQFVIVNVRPNRAAKRAAMFHNIKQPVGLLPAQIEVAPERKVTGAVRRGLSRGKTA